MASVHLKFPCRGAKKKIVELFTFDPVSKKAQCITCQQSDLSSNQTRLKYHVISCSKISYETKCEFIHPQDLNTYDDVVQNHPKSSIQSPQITSRSSTQSPSPATTKSSTQSSHVTQGCASHQLNILVKHVLQIKTINESIQQMENVIAKIQTPPTMCAKFREFWSSFEESPNKYHKFTSCGNAGLFAVMRLYQSILNAEPVLQQFVVIDPEHNFEPAFVELWTNSDHYEKLKNESKMMNLIGCSIALIERDEATLGILPTVMNALKERMEVIIFDLKATKTEKKQLIRLIDERCEFMITKETLLANILDPELRGRSLTADQLVLGLNFADEYFKLNNYSPDRIKSIKSKFQEYQSSSGIFSSFLHQKGSDIASVDWWKTFRNYNSFKDIVQFAVSILSVRPATAKLGQLLIRPKPDDYNHTKLNKKERFIFGENDANDRGLDHLKYNELLNYLINVDESNLDVLRPKTMILKIVY